MLATETLHICYKYATEREEGDMNLENLGRRGHKKVGKHSTKDHNRKKVGNKAFVNQ